MVITRKPDDYYFDADTLWGRESKRLHAAALADPSNRSLQVDLAWAEHQRAISHAKRAATWEREQAEEYARQGSAWAGDHVFDTMSGGTIVR